MAWRGHPTGTLFLLLVMNMLRRNVCLRTSAESERPVLRRVRELDVSDVALGRTRNLVRTCQPNTNRLKVTGNCGITSGLFCIS